MSGSEAHSSHRSRSSGSGARRCRSAPSTTGSWATTRSRRPRCNRTARRTVSDRGCSPSPPNSAAKMWAGRGAYSWSSRCAADLAGQRDPPLRRSSRPLSGVARQRLQRGLQLVLRRRQRRQTAQCRSTVRLRICVPGRDLRRPYGVPRGAPARRTDRAHARRRGVGADGAYAVRARRARPADRGAPGDLSRQSTPLLRRHRERVGDRVGTALSGGYDSRLTLALCRAHGIRLSVHVYCNANDADVRVA